MSSKFEDFLGLQDASEITKEIEVSERLKGLTIKIKALDAKTHNRFMTQCRGDVKKGGIKFDGGKFNLLIVENQVIEPNFRDAKFLEQAKCANATEFIEKKLLVGEIVEIAEQVSKLRGFDLDINDAVEEAKNL